MTDVYLEQINNIIEVRCAKNGRYGARLGFHDRHAEWFWMSAKQFSKLERCFDKTPNGYTCGLIQVYGVFDRDDRGERFVWAGTHSERWSDLTFLAERFGVELPDYVEEDIEMVKVPEHVDVHPDLLD